MDKDTFEELKTKQDENAAQIVVGIRPTCEYCKTCIFNNGGTIDSNDYHKIYCAIFKNPEMKPNDVMMKGAACPAYVKQ